MCVWVRVCVCVCVCVYLFLIIVCLVIDDKELEEEDPLPFNMQILFTTETPKDGLTTSLLTSSLAFCIFVQDDVSSIVDRDEGDNSMGNEDVRGGKNCETSD